MNEVMAHQLTLGVSLKDDATFENFYSEHNQPLIHALQSAAKGEGERVIYFYGTTGEGRTHLLQACCHAAHQYQRRTVYLPLHELIAFSPQVLEGLESLDLICVDDVHCIAGRLPWEEAFFHAYNRIREAGNHLIVTANVPPRLLPLSLKDLGSRLVWGVGYELQPLSDDEKLQVLIKRAERRGLMLSEDVSQYLLSHCPRHLTSLFTALDILDKASLAAQRRLTIPFVKSVLKI